MASKYIIELKDVKFDDSIKDCDICLKTKAKKKSCSNTYFINSEPLKLIHTDTVGPISPSTFQFGNHYIITLTDDATKYVWAYPVPNKTSVHITQSLSF